jgi:Mrp family chromosome partitioning ATPase
MSFTTPLAANSTRTLAPFDTPPIPIVEPSSAAGTTYEMCLADEQDDPRLTRQYRRLLNAVMTELPPTSGGTILVTGTGSSSHVADVVGQLARLLTTECQSDVLLADVDAGQRVLSQRFAAAGDHGFVDALQDRLPVRNWAAKTVVARLSFLPFGQGTSWRRALVPEAARELVADCRKSFRYTLLAGGGEVSPLTQHLARHCDATYLVVQLGQADRLKTVQCTHELVSCGARLLGCIATGYRG